MFWKFHSNLIKEFAITGKASPMSIVIKQYILTEHLRETLSGFGVSMVELTGAMNRCTIIGCNLGASFREIKEAELVHHFIQPLSEAQMRARRKPWKNKAYYGRY